MSWPDGVADTAPAAWVAAVTLAPEVPAPAAPAPGGVPGAVTVPGEGRWPAPPGGGAPGPVPPDPLPPDPLAPELLPPDPLPLDRLPPDPLAPVPEVRLVTTVVSVDAR